MYGKIKVVIVTILSIMICELSFVNSPLQVMAEEMKESRTLEMMKERRSLEYYLYEQENVYTGIIDENLEKELNCKGLFDSEIELLSCEEVENIQNAEEVNIYCEYVEINESGEESEELEQNIDERVLSEGEVNELFKELYYSDESDSMLTKFEKKIGLMPQEVLANEVINRSANSTAYVKRSFIIVDTGDVFSVTGVNKWLIMPENRFSDYIIYDWCGATQYCIGDNNNTNKYTVKTYATYHEYYKYGGKLKLDRNIEEVNDFTNLVEFNKNVGSFAIIAFFDLPRYDENAGNGREFDDYHEIILTDFSAKITFYLKKIQRDQCFYMEYDYFHQKRKINGKSAKGLAVDIAQIAPTILETASIGSIAGTIWSALSAKNNLKNVYDYYYDKIGQGGGLAISYK